MIFDLIRSTAFSVWEVFRPLPAAADTDLLATELFGRAFPRTDVFDFFMGYQRDRSYWLWPMADMSSIFPRNATTSISISTPLSSLPATVRTGFRFGK